MIDRPEKNNKKQQQNNEPAIIISKFILEKNRK